MKKIFLTSVIALIVAGNIRAAEHARKTTEIRINPVRHIAQHIAGS